MSSKRRVALGAVFQNDVAIHEIQGTTGWTFQTFTIAPNRPSFRRIPDSAFATPGRYVAEVFSRLLYSTEESGGVSYFIFNPLFTTTRLSILIVVAELRSQTNHSIPTVLVDRDDLPVGYLLPKTFNVGDAPYLALLSTVDASLDAQLLGQLCSSGATILKDKRLRLGGRGGNGFHDQEIWPVYRWVAQNAITLLEAISTANAGDSDQASAKRHRDKIPFTAIMPNHAGDVLFFALAFNEVHSLYQRIAVNRAYAAIVEDAAPSLGVITIDTGGINRDAAFAAGNAIRDYEHFLDYKDALPPGNFYTYCRPSRNYNVTDFHLIDHFAFALGHSARKNADLVMQSRRMPQRFAGPLATNTPAKILLHFDAGWPLKIYPQKLQFELIELLLARGHQLTVLAPAGYAYPGVEITTFRSLSQFVALARSQHLIVGMDSFPSHYCTHKLGLPTLCLFSSTKPANSNAAPAGHYSFLEKGLKCRPCYAIARCPVYGGTECRNFVEPNEVADEIEALLRGAAREKPVIHLEDQSFLSTLKTVNIYTHSIALQIFLARLVPTASRATMLFSEFLSATRREGLMPAIYRSVRFLIRKVRTFR